MQSYKQTPPIFLAALLLSLSWVPPLSAADQAGRFVLKGAANAGCNDYLKAYEDKPGGFLLYLGWLGGYITALNQYRNNTYDLTSWESMGLLAASLHSYCSSHPSASFFGASQRLVEALNADSLETFTPGIEVHNRGVTLTLNQPLVSRVHRQLAELGLYSGAPDASFGDDSKAAMSAYQKQHGLPPTGLPDQLTLYQMFREAKAGANPQPE